MKRMKHPDHGFHHAYSTQEEATLRANGWVDDVPTEPQMTEQPEEPIKRKPGPRPKIIEEQS